MDVCLFFMDDFKHSLRLIPSKYRRRQLNYFGSVHGREQALPCCCWLVNHSPFVETWLSRTDPPPPCGIALPRLHCLILAPAGLVHMVTKAWSQRNRIAPIWAPLPTISSPDSPVKPLRLTWTLYRELSTDLCLYTIPWASVLYTGIACAYTVTIIPDHISSQAIGYNSQLGYAYTW